LVSVVLFTASEHFHKVELLLNKDTASAFESFETLHELLLFGGSLLRRVACWWVLLRWVLLWGILLGWVLLGWVLLGRILLGRVLLGRIALLRRVLLWGIASLLLGIGTLLELDLDSLWLLHYWKVR
jgi:hypothetical protein